jgi:hypothetical protein
VLEYDKKEIGTIKLTVGVLKGSQQHIQYCITAIEEKILPADFCIDANG